MGSDSSKLQCLCLPAQSGKTRKVEELITLFQEENENLDIDADFNIFISANNKLLVHQTTTRIRRDLGTDSACASASAASDGAAAAASDSVDSDDDDDDTDVPSNAVIKGRIFSWTSGSRHTGITVPDLAFRALDRDIEMVVVCAHKQRLRLVYQLLQKLETSKNFKQKINIWIDEADNSMRLWSKYPDVLAMHHVNKVTLVSATFEAVFRKYDRLRVLGYKTTHPECYRGLADCEQKTVDYVDEPHQYIAHILDTTPTLSAPGIRLFTPGEMGKASHAAVAETLLGRGWAGIIINGDRKELLIPGESVRDLRPYLTVSTDESIPPEFNETLARLYKSHRLHERPFFITGYLCVQRGVTFQCAPAKDSSHDGFVFDGGIIPHIGNKAEAYQTMARLFGNTGHFPNYKKPVIYSDSRTFSHVKEQQNVAINLARMVAEEGLEEVTSADMLRAGGRQEAPRKSNKIAMGGLEEFSSLAALKSRWEEIVEDGSYFRSPNKDKESGYYVCSLGKESKRQTAADVRATLKDTNSAKFWGSGFTKAVEGEKVTRIYVGYESNDTPVFFLRWAEKA